MNKTFFKKTKKFLYPIKYSKFNFIATLICWIIWALVSVYSIVFLKNITNAIELRDWDKVKSYSIIWFIVISLWLLIRTFYKIFPFRFFADTYTNIYNLIMIKYFNWDNTKIEKIWTWKIISIIQKWLRSWFNLLGILSWEVAYELFISILVFYNLWKTNIYVMFIWLILLLFCFFWIILFYPKATFWREKTKIIDTEIDRITVLHIMNKFEIFQNNKQEKEIKKIYSKRKEWYNYKIREKIWQGFSYDGIEYFMNIALLLTAFYFSYLIFNWNAGLWDFILFTGFATLLWNQIKTFSRISKRFNDDYIHIEKMQELIKDIKDKQYKVENEKKKFFYKSWKIEIKNLNFSYDKLKIFNKFSLNIPWWTKTAFVWESWWWKTTLMKLLVWYIKPDYWSIIIDWQKLSNIKLSDYYKYIGYLTQDPSVFDGTILENLTYALKEKPSEKEIKKAIKLAKCDFIFDFKNGFNTKIWERWIRLSWGQKQRLAIAKIMLKKPKIIFLDEPTSALDSFNEEMINIALNNLFKWKTVIVIAHRLQTVKEADNIFLFEKGKVIESWTHNKLIKLNWKYKKMLDLQSGF